MKKINTKILSIMFVIFLSYLNYYCFENDKKNNGLIINYFQNHGYKYIKKEYIDVRKLNRIPFLNSDIYKVVFLNYHPAKYFYFTIIKDQVYKLNTEVNGEIPDLNILKDNINQRTVLNLANAKEFSIFYLNLINSGYPDKIISSKKEIIKRVKPEKLKEFKKLTINPICYYIKDNQKIIEFFTYGRFDTSISKAQLIIGSNYIKFKRDKLLNEISGRKIIY